MDGRIGPGILFLLRGPIRAVNGVPGSLYEAMKYQALE
jgi:hypothetical protein